MNKKVLSAILFSALFAGTGTFTSCIDNDEPAGIEELRGAKAELLRAKVAVEQANAAKVLAQAEIAKAKAAKIQAEAKIEEAKAKIKEAKAEAEEANTAVAKAEAEKKIAKYQRQMEEAALEHQVTMVGLQKQLANAQRSYELTLAAIEVAKQLLPYEKKVELDSYQGAVDYWNMAVGGAKEDLETKQKAYDRAVLVNEFLGQISTDSLKYMVDTAEVKLADAKAELTKYENWLEEDVTTKDWRAEIDSLNAIIEELEKESAKLELDTARAKNSLEYKALLAAVDSLEKPAVVDTVYGHKYFDQDYATTLYGTKAGNSVTTSLSDGASEVTDEAAKMAEITEASLKLIAEYDADGKLIDGQLFDDKDSLASFTTERMFWLDSVAKIDSADASIYKADSDTAISKWKKALEAYNKTTPIDSLNQWKQDALDAATTFSTKIAAATTKADSTAAAAAYKTALLKWYDGAKKNGMTLGKVAFSSKAMNAAQTGVIDIWTTADVYTLLSDATNGTANLLKMLDYDYDGSSITSDYFVANASTTETEIKFTGTDGKAASVKINLTSAITKAADDSYYQTLVEASFKAFGSADLYVNKAELTSVARGNYLYNQPSEDDARYVGYKGDFGAYVLSQDIETLTFAQNYKSIMANLEAAIAYWEATYTTLKAKFDAQEAAKDAAEEAVAEYEAANIDIIDEKLGDLAYESTRLDRIVTALAKAVNTYLPEDLQATAPDTYEVEAFKVILEQIVADAKNNVDYYTRELANAKLAVELNETYTFTALATAKAELDAAVATLENAQAELDKALANLEKVLEIITATVGE